MNVVAALTFLGFVLLGLAAARGGRRAARAFLAYAVFVSFGFGTIQIDAWPFSAWPLVAGTLPLTITHPRLVAVDAQGAEHDVDYRAWEPLAVDELMAWAEARWLSLDPPLRDEAAGHLLDLAETARARARDGQPFSRSERWLGSLSAPYFILHPRRWGRIQDVPERGFVGLRLYSETWILGARSSGDGRIWRRKLYEYLR